MLIEILSFALVISCVAALCFVLTALFKLAIIACLLFLVLYVCLKVLEPLFRKDLNKEE